MKILTEYVFPPIPLRDFDWSAVTDNYEPGCPIGYGRTEEEAIADLMAEIEAREDIASEDLAEDQAAGL